MSQFGSLQGAPATLLLSGARVIDPAAGTDQIRDMAIVDGRLADERSVPPGVCLLYHI
jgi:predicted amidohydrolase